MKLKKTKWRIYTFLAEIFAQTNGVAFIYRMHKGIKNIIFDLGGVLLQLNMQATAEAFKRIGFADVDDVYSQKKQVELFNQFDKGQITPDDFRNGIRGFIGSYIPAKMIEDAWNAMLGPLPQNHVDMLLELKNEFNIFLLSNTNEIHIASFENYIEHAYEKDLLTKLFHKVYYSCRIGMRKPDKEIFDFVVQQNNLVAGETIFIDDSLHHVEGARLAGINSYHLPHNKSVEELIVEIFEV